jgi:CubicO group peptidase (beta-lactamase class C family)
MTRSLVMRLAVLLAVGLCSVAARAQGLPKASPESAGMSGQRLARLTQAMKAEIEQGKLPGAVVMVARHGKLVYAERFGFQDKGEGKPMALDTIFRIYSMTKPLASVAAMTLVEEGRMQLTDPVSKFLPPMKNLQVSVPRTDQVFAKVSYMTAPAEREILVHDLLRHTSGLAYGEITQNAPVKEAYVKAGVYQAGVRDYAKAPLAHQPGTVWEYSMAVDVLGRVVEAVSGKRLSEVIDERIVRPLKMVDTAFWVPKDRIGRLAQPLPTDPASGQPNRLFDVSAPPKNDSGGAGAVSTASDYLRFCEMLLEGGQLEGARVLSRTTVDLMTSDHLGTRIATPVNPGEFLIGTPGYTFGLGFAVRQGPGIAGVPGSPGEFMWAGYAGTYFWVDPKEKLVAVYMTQAPSPIRAYYRRLMKQLVYQAIVD